MNFTFHLPSTFLREQECHELGEGMPSTRVRYAFYESKVCYVKALVIGV